MAIVTQREGMGWTCTLVLFEVAAPPDDEREFDITSMEHEATTDDELQGLLEEWRKY